MRGPVWFLVVTLVGCSSPRVVLGARRPGVAVPVADFGDEAPSTTSMHPPSGWRRLQDRLGIPETLRELVTVFMPLRYHWLALGGQNATGGLIGVWEVVVSFDGEFADSLRFVGAISPCKIASRPNFRFVAFMHRGRDLLVGCQAVRVQASLLESWRIPRRRSTRGFEHSARARFVSGRQLTTLEHLLPRSARHFLEVGDWDAVVVQSLCVAFSPSTDSLAVIERFFRHERVGIMDTNGRDLCGVRLPDGTLPLRGSDIKMGFTGTWLTICIPGGSESFSFRVDRTQAGCRMVRVGNRRPCCDAAGSGLILYRSDQSVSIGNMSDETNSSLYDIVMDDVSAAGPHCMGDRFSPDGRRALVHNEEHVYLWAFEDGRHPVPVPHGMVFSDDGALLVGLSDLGLKLLDIGTASVLDVALEGNATQEYQGLLAVSGPHGWDGDERFELGASSLFGLRAQR